MSAAGRPSELHPRSVAKELGLHVEGVPSWPALLDAACARYWEVRTERKEKAA